uniref:Uncharacterized protein n=1 Tax=Toxoplasma gondii (strain ATCC 50861 / VEG) TaxID=432359 RepID=A0A0F7V4S3_TOXGV|nr:TPA: hypothetical protein BN1205_096340 [Toxoplasma gondii VEG]
MQPAESSRQAFEFAASVRRFTCGLRPVCAFLSLPPEVLSRPQRFQKRGRKLQRLASRSMQRPALEGIQQLHSGVWTSGQRRQDSQRERLGMHRHQILQKLHWRRTRATDAQRSCSGRRLRRNGTGGRRGRGVRALRRVKVDRRRDGLWRGQRQLEELEQQRDETLRAFN